MNATTLMPARRRSSGIAILTVLLGVQSVMAITFAVVLSSLLGALSDDLTIGPRFMAGAAVIFAITAYFTARAVWRLRPGAYVVAATLQIVVALSVAVATVTGGFHPALLGALALAGATFIALSLPAVRRALNQV